MKYGNGTGSPLKIIKTTSGTSAETQQSGAAEHVTSVKLPTIDIDSVPIPPADQPRETDALQLPALFASVTPQIGLAHEKRKSVIDKEVSAYFSTKTVQAIDGEHTKTMPQQKGLAFTKVMLPQGKRSEILIKGIDDRIYKGTIHDSENIETDVTSDVSHSSDDQNLETKQGKISKPAKEKPDIPSLKEPRTRKGFKKPVIHKPKLSSIRDTHLPAIVSLHVDGKPLQTSPVIIKSNPVFMVPTDQLKSVKKSSGI
ncbi:uncharacterized protein LOC118198914 [Stegodyphus dumicola]|uniref:uncharacterized protein LOC118198914 n=1 Tax=Stegodyphus dumicola TaxID=202533 RepID=UPI0015AB201A|nr:uncharacterized protein LOC118198914 [Stegodyphus dumicola]